MQEQADFFWSTLLAWYDEKGRDFPWRNTKDPFHVLVAEFLLQQTHVRKVAEVYQHILEKFPSPYHMARADLEDLQELIKPIGLIYRAVRLKKTAEQLCQQYQGKVPPDYKELRRLPGVGDYIANAVLCYGYNQPTVPIDTNMIRLFSRYFGYVSEKSRPRTDPILAASIRKHFVHFDHTRNPNLAVLDFAAEVCTARNPQSEQCPLNRKCCEWLS